MLFKFRHIYIQSLEDVLFRQLSCIEKYYKPTTCMLVITQYHMDGIMHKWADPHFDEFENKIVQQHEVQDKTYEKHCQITYPPWIRIITRDVSNTRRWINVTILGQRRRRSIKRAMVSRLIIFPGKTLNTHHTRNRVFQSPHRHSRSRHFVVRDYRRVCHVIEMWPGSRLSTRSRLPTDRQLCKHTATSSNCVS